MGDVRRYSCRCGYEAELRIGCGFMSNILDTIKRCIPEDGFAPFYKAYSAGEVSNCLMETVIARCGSCKQIVPVNALSYTLRSEINHSPETEASDTIIENGETPSPREARYICACPVCGGEVDEEKDIERIRCPKCGGKMHYQEIGVWD